MKNIYFFIIIITCIGCGGNPSSTMSEEKIPVIDLEEVLDGKKQEFLLSDIAKGIEYIPLEFTPECPIKLGTANWDIYFSSTNIFVLSNLIYRFDRNGKYLNRIGAKGHGPGEYVRANFFTVDTVARRVYLYSDGGQTIVYNYDGKHIRTLRLEARCAEGLCFVSQTKELVYTGAESGFHHPDHFFLNVTDTMGNTRFKKKAMVSSMLRGEEKAWWELRTMQDGDDILAYDFMNDTIFRYRKSVLEPYLILKFGKYKVTLDAMNSVNYQLETGKCFRMMFLGSTPKYLFLYLFRTGDFPNKRYTIRYDKSTGECVPGTIVNDLDGGKPWVDLHYCKNQWIILKEAFDMKETINLSAAEAKAKDPQAFQQLKKLTGKLGDEDNPVLMRIILK